jgi:hypothetical protein
MENGLPRSLGICWLEFSLFIYIVPSLVEGMGVEPQALSAVFRLGTAPLLVVGVGCLSRRLYQGELYRTGVDGGNIAESLSEVARWRGAP